MDYEQFLQQITEDLRGTIHDADVEVTETAKLQGESYRGILVKVKDSPAAVSMNLHGAYERMQEGMDYHDILQSIHDQAVSAVDQGRRFNTDMIHEYGKARERLCIEVVPIRGNEEMLSGIPHTVMEDLAVIHRIDLDDHASATVTNSLLESYGITEKQLHEDALASAPEVRPAVIKPMYEILGIPAELADLSAPQLYVATTEEQVNGAGVIAYPGVLEEAADMLGGNFYILPSSIHELLFLPQKGTTDYRDLEAMVREINETQVAPSERLSNSVYHYDSRDRVFELAERFEQRMKEHDADRPSMLEKLKEKKAEAARQSGSTVPSKEREAMIR